MTTDALDRLRASALDGLAHKRVIPISAARRRARDDGRAPTLPPHAIAVEKETLPMVLLEGAELEWRRASHPWTPSLARLVVDGVLTVAVKGGDVTVAMRNATYRTSALPARWVPVVVAALTERELPTVRAAMRRGVNLFAPLAVPERAP